MTSHFLHGILRSNDPVQLLTPLSRQKATRQTAENPHASLGYFVENILADVLSLLAR